MTNLTAFDAIVDVVAALTPDFQHNGKRFFGKMPEGHLAFYHYLQQPARPEALDTLDEYGINLDQYAKYIERMNGCTLFDKIFSLYGFGDTFACSLRLEDQTAYQLESENPVFSYLNSDARKGRVRKVGSIDLKVRYDLIINPDGVAALDGSEGILANFKDFDSAVCAIVQELQRIATFPIPLGEVEWASVENELSRREQVQLFDSP